MTYLPTARLIVTSYPYRSFCTSKLSVCSSTLTLLPTPSTTVRVWRRLRELSLQILKHMCVMF